MTNYRASSAFNSSLNNGLPQNNYQNYRSISGTYENPIYFPSQPHIGTNA